MEKKFPIIPVVLNAVAMLSHMHDDIDKIYYSNVEEYFKVKLIRTESEFYKSLPEQHKIYYEKLEAIMSLGLEGLSDYDVLFHISDNFKTNLFVSLVNKAYKRIYQTIKKVPQDEFVGFNFLIKDDITSDEGLRDYLAKCGVTTFYALLLDKEVDMNNNGVLMYIQYLKNHEVGRVSTKGFSDRIVEKKKVINEIYNKLKRKNIFNCNIGESKDDLTRLGLLSVPLTCNGLDDTLVKSLYPHTEKDVKKLILFAHDIGVSSHEDIAFMDMYEYYILSGCYMATVIRAYEDCGKALKRESHSRNLEAIRNKNLEKEQAIIKNKNDALRSSNLAKDDEIAQLKTELEKANKKIDELKKDSEDNRLAEQELYGLRELMFNMESKDIHEVVTEDTEISITNKLLVVGGHSNLIVKLKKRLPNSTFIGADKLNFNTDLIEKDISIVIITNYLSHGMYYKVINKARETENPLIYINSGSNIDYIVKYISSKL